MLLGWLQLARVVPFWQGALAKKAATNLRSKQKFCFEICELRDIFLRRLEPNITQALGRAVLKNMEDNSRFFVWAENNEPEQNLPKKIRSANAL